jgi:hypothetical protein
MDTKITMSTKTIMVVLDCRGIVVVGESAAPAARARREGAARERAGVGPRER